MNTGLLEVNDFAASPSHWDIFDPKTASQVNVSGASHFPTLSNPYLSQTTVALSLCSAVRTPLLNHAPLYQRPLSVQGE